MIPLYAIIGPRNEDDIIYATVKHMFVQGANEVFIYDGGSTDGTIKEAKLAGAQILHIEDDTGKYDERKRASNMRLYLEKELDRKGCTKAWVCLLDADDFLMSSNPKLTLREFLNNLADRFNIVGSFRYEHYPKEEPYYMPHFHPLDFMPCWRYFSFPGHCPHNHWKHSVLIHDKEKSPLSSRYGSGFHKMKGDDCESTESLILHHFPFRNKKRTYERYKDLCEIKINTKEARIAEDERQIGHISGIFKRYKSLDSVYSKEIPYDGTWNVSIYRLFRWYSYDKLQEVKRHK